MPTLEDALELAEARSFTVIPVHHPEMDLSVLPDFVRRRVDPTSKEFSERDIGKIPLVAWEAYQKTPPKRGEIEAWWKKWPDANVGVVCGEQSGAFVVDADGPEAVQFLERLGIDSGSTLTARTGRGHQFYFLWPGFEVPNRIGQVFGGLDIKGDGGYVVAPPSRHRSGADYAWENGVTAPLPAPEELIEIIRQQAKRKTEKHRLPSTEVERLLKGPIPRGEQHNAAKTLFAHWIAIGMSERAIREAAYTWGQSVCQPPGDDAHLQKIVTWALEQESTKRRNPEEPRMERRGDDFVFAWPELGIRAELTELHRIGERIQGALDITSEAHGDIHYGDIVLGSTSAREELTHPTRGKLSRVRSDLNWGVMIERICKMAARSWRQGEPTIVLKPSPADSPRILRTGLPGPRPFCLPAGETTVLFADGGTGKSLLSLQIAVNISNAIPILYLDWESTHEEHGERLAAILKGMGKGDYGSQIHYRRMVRPLWQQVSVLRAELALTGAKMVIADSYGPASMGAGDWTEAAIRTMDALHALGADVTRLLLTHVTKEAAERADGAGKPIASAYVYNLARSVWEMRQGDPESEDTIILRLDHRKANRGKRQRPLGYEIAFTESQPDVLESVAVGWRSPDTIQINGHIALESRISDAVTRLGGSATAAELAEETGEKPETIRQCIRRRANLFVTLASGGGRGHEARYGLRASRTPDANRDENRDRRGYTKETATSL